MKLLAICIGSPEKLPGKSYKTGINKMAVNAPVMIDRLGLMGDAVCNTKHHGGEDQAILLEGSLTLDWWAKKLGHHVPPGLFGENLVVEGLDNRHVAVGDRFHMGDVVLEATMPRVPCNTLAARLDHPGFAKLYREAASPGIYCRVLQPGLIAAGAPVSIEPYAGKRIFMSELLVVYGKRLPEIQKARYLSAPVASRLRQVLDR